MSVLRLIVVPDEWSSLPPFIPGNPLSHQMSFPPGGNGGSGSWRALGGGGGSWYAAGGGGGGGGEYAPEPNLVVTAGDRSYAQELARKLAWLGLIDANGNPVPAVPASQPGTGASSGAVSDEISVS